MNRNKQIKITNSLVSLTGICFILISVNKLFFTKQNSGLLTNSIGSISFFENDIRLKRTSHFEWQNVDCGRLTGILQLKA